MNPAQIERELTYLHPAMWYAVRRVIARLQHEKSNFRVFESVRSPMRQQWLYEQGRSRPGKKVTDAQAWASLHQYGLAVDFAIRNANGWSWNATEDEWKFLHDVGRAAGLEPISWEKPHLQFAGQQIIELQHGMFPDLKSFGSDSSNWQEWLEAQAITWPAGAPPVEALKYSHT